MRSIKYCHSWFHEFASSGPYFSPNYIFFNSPSSSFFIQIVLCKCEAREIMRQSYILAQASLRLPRQAGIASLGHKTSWQFIFLLFLKGERVQVFKSLSRDSSVMRTNGCSSLPSLLHCKSLVIIHLCMSRCSFCRLPCLALLAKVSPNKCCLCLALGWVL